MAEQKTSDAVMFYVWFLWRVHRREVLSSKMFGVANRLYEAEFGKAFKVVDWAREDFKDLQEIK